MAYDNMISPLVKACKYFTMMEFDILLFCIITILTGEQKNGQLRARLKEDGATLADWLKNISVFIGELYKKYSQIELTPILKFIVNQLKSGEFYDLIVLKEIVSKMGGIENADNATESQLEALAGGPVLTQEGFAGEKSDAMKESSWRLGKGILDSKCSGLLAVLMGQIRARIMWTQDNEDQNPQDGVWGMGKVGIHVKLLGNALDMVCF